MPGALVAAVAWSLAQELGTDLLTRRVEGAQQTYGSFALVIGILFWFFVLAQITLYCCELNVVLQDKLWPRSLRAILQREAETDGRRQGLHAVPAAREAGAQHRGRRRGHRKGGPDQGQS